jgi:hypothetical protein
MKHEIKIINHHIFDYTLEIKCRNLTIFIFYFSLFVIENLQNHFIFEFLFLENLLHWEKKDH